MACAFKGSTNLPDPNAQLQLRAALECDRDFLFAVFTAALPPPVLPELSHLQFRGWLQTYSIQYPDPGPQIVEDLASNSKLGFVWLHHSLNEHRIVDLAIVPELRNRGIGAAIIAHLHASARAAGVPMRASVALHNEGSLRFNLRNGARVIGTSPTHWAIEWPVSSSTPSDEQPENECSD